MAPDRCGGARGRRGSVSVRMEEREGPWSWRELISVISNLRPFLAPVLAQSPKRWIGQT